jgi:predicted aminopeptidase
MSLALSGCYYTQAARGQLEVMRKREPITEVIAADETPAELARRLQLVVDARDFSIRELGLPDNDSYRSYADLDRDSVVWNVFAAPEFSLEPKTWCFPVAGCVAYRGYFAEKSAKRRAEKLRAQGFDVAVGGIPAYSTLGRFSDPVLNTMMHWEDADLIATIFHELAHQVLYVKGDSGFNESFATVVEQVGIERWLISRDEQDALEAYLERRELRTALMQLVAEARQDLKRLYMSRIAPEEMRRRKAARFDALDAALSAEIVRTGRNAPVWTGDGLNNARLVSLTLYHGRVDEFRALLTECSDDLKCFYREASKLARTSDN